MRRSSDLARRHPEDLPATRSTAGRGPSLQQGGQHRTASRRGVPATERNLMRYKLAAIALAASVIAIPAGALATAGTANAATPSCGKSCIDVFSQTFGTYLNPQFVIDAYKRGQNVGQPVILFRESNADPAEDFTVADEGTVSDFYAAGLMSRRSGSTTAPGRAPSPLRRARPGTSTRTSTRSRRSTPRTARTPACASASPPPLSRVRRSPSSRAACPRRRCGWSITTSTAARSPTRCTCWRRR